MSIHQVMLTCVLCCCCAFKSTPGTGRVPDSTKKTDRSESAKAIKSITGFLQWYKAHLHKVNAFPLLAKDRKGYFVVDKKACTAYLNFLQGSHFISAEYIGYWQTYFNDKATVLKEQKIKEDIPEGFDMDFILITQEPEIVLNNINKLQFNIVSVHSKVILIGVKLPRDKSVQYEIEMYNGKAGWQIGYISSTNFD